MKKLQAEFDEIYERVENILVDGFKEAVENMADESFTTSEFMVAEIFRDVWDERSEELEALIEQLDDIVENAENVDSGDISSKKEDLLHYYEGTGFADFQQKLDEMSDDEIEDLYDETFE